MESEGSGLKKVSTLASTLVVGGSTFLSRILGFLRNMVVSYFFGASGTADVLNFVFNIPNNLRKLLAEGALSSAFIPQLTRTHQEDPTGERSRDLARALLTFQLGVIIPLILGAVAFAEPIIHVLADFPEASQMALSVELFRWFILYLVFISVSAVFIGVQNSHNQFLIPSVAPLLFSLSVIGFLVLLYPWLGVHAQTVGILVGGLAQVMVQLPSILKLGYSLVPKIRFLTPDFQVVLRKYAPTISTSLIFLISQQVSMKLATSLAEGSVASFTYALIFWQLPQGVFAASIATVFFPRMSRQAALGDRVGLGESVTQGLQGLLLFLIPSAVFIQFMSLEMIHLALQHGAFTPEASRMTADIFIVLSWGLFGVGAFNFLIRLFYSDQDFRTPFWISLFAVAADLTVTVSFMHTSWGVRALALGNTTAYTLGFLILLGLARRRMENFSLSALGIFTVKLGVALVIPALFLWGSDLIWPLDIAREAGGHEALRFILRGIGALGLFLGAGSVLKLDFIRYLKRRKEA